MTDDSKTISEQEIDPDNPWDDLDKDGHAEELVEELFGQDSPDYPEVKEAEDCGGDSLGLGYHVNVSDMAGGHIGSILCCPCCDGPATKIQCKINTIFD